MSIKSVVRNNAIGRRVLLFLYERKKLSKHRAHEKTVLAASKEKQHIFYCGICESSNMGDMAQTYCTLKWLERHYPLYEILPCRTSVLMDARCDMIGTMKKVMKKGDLIFFQSGYNTHDLGGNEDLMHQKVIAAFPDVEMIMLPQTVYFQSDERKKQCAESYNAHKKMLFLARDPISEQSAKEMFPSLDVRLYPDIVTSLIGSYDCSNAQRKGVYLCRRKDVEQYYTEEDYLRFKALLSRFDEVEVSDTIITASNDDIYRDLEGYVSSIVRRFASFRAVVTDKFHGLIFSMIAGTPVVVIKTKDHKVTSGYEWFSRYYPNLVYYADSDEQIEKAVEGILANARYEKPDDYFNREYYEKLYDLIAQWENRDADM